MGIEGSFGLARSSAQEKQAGERLHNWSLSCTTSAQPLQQHLHVRAEPTWGSAEDVKVSPETP